MALKTQVLSLYKSLMRESDKFSNYNFRSYAQRRIRDGFKDKKSLTDTKEIKNQIEFGKGNLAIITRQAAVGNLYRSDKLVIENLYSRLST